MVAGHLQKLGFEQGVGHPCVFVHKGRGIKTLIHGDDYCSSGFREDLEWLEQKLKERFEIKTQKLDENDNAEGKILNRIIRRTTKGWEIEADPRHAELIVEQLLRERDKSVNAPRGGRQGGEGRTRRRS